MTGDISNYFIAPNEHIKKALNILESTPGKIALVVDNDNHLLGTITDGDIRRGLLDGHALDSQVSLVMNKEPQTVNINEDKATIFSLMQSKSLRNYPMVDDTGRVLDIANIADIITPEKLDNWVVIMAGGLGERLRPLTDNTPKPMLEVDGSPVLELLIKTFISQGFYRFYVSVNYLAEKIKDHFGDGTQYGIEIRYLEEKEPLGTAGSLSLLGHKPKHPFIVINGDIVTNICFTDILDFHLEEESSVTMGVYEHAVQIPYGVVDLNGTTVCDFSEKPTEKYFINTGIYSLSPDVLDLVPDNTAMTMPELVTKVQKNNHSVNAFPVTKSWLDIGRMEDFAKAEDLVKEIRIHNKI